MFCILLLFSLADILMRLVIKILAGSKGYVSYLSLAALL